MDNYNDSSSSSSGSKKPSRKSAAGAVTIILIVMMAILSLWSSDPRASFSFTKTVVGHYIANELNNNNNNEAVVSNDGEKKDNENEKDDPSPVATNHSPTTTNIPGSTVANNNSNNHSKTVTTLDNNNNNDDNRILTIVVQMSGELGNQVYKLAHGLCVQDYIQQELAINTKLILRAQTHAKWKHAMEWTQQAFPKTRSLNFRQGNTPEFDAMHKQQEQWVDRKLKLATVLPPNDARIPDKSLLKEFSCAEPNCYADLLTLVNYTWNTMEHLPTPIDNDSNNISMPHVYITSFLGHHCWDRMYDTYKDYFQIDEEAICKHVPDPDESVLHLRNFLVEMPRKGKQLGFEQLGPNVTASRLFRDYQPGDKVAIISRFPDKVQEFINALKDQKGIQARYITNQTGNQDFCFLYKAKKEIMGQKISTFVSLAGILGNANKVRLYSVESLATRTRKVHFFNQSFEHEALRKRIVFENYNLTHG